MSVAPLGPAESLPQSHVFVFLARGASIRTIRVHIVTMWAGAGIAALLTCWLVGSGLYLAFHDDLVATLMAREAATQYAYEDRIAALRGEVQRESSQKLVGQTTLDARLRDLTERAAALEARASLLTQIAPRAGSTAASASDVGGDGDVTGTLRAPLTGAATRLPDAKPHPEIEGRLATPDVVAAATQATPSFAIRLSSLEERLERVDAGQYRSLAALGQAARGRADVLRAALQSAGLSPGRLVKSVTPALGGPFEPLNPAVTGSPFGKALETMQGDLTEASGLIEALPHVPFARPLVGAMEVTSPFGARLDPFLGRPAMHTGVDLAEAYGTEVRATAAGRVVTAGTVGGYGTMIEIDHGHGLSTRYAHLSAVGVSVGQVVEKGAVIGDVGASGRATGPHLHYETRIDGEAVDPMRFLNAGSRLAASL